MGLSEIYRHPQNRISDTLEQSASSPLPSHQNSYHHHHQHSLKQDTSPKTMKHKSPSPFLQEGQSSPKSPRHHQHQSNHHEFQGSNTRILPRLASSTNPTAVLNALPAKSMTTLSNDVVKFRPHPMPEGHDFKVIVNHARYATSVDERGYLSVYEYALNGHFITWDYVTGLVHFTQIWKALGNLKADIVKLVESQPDLVRVIRRIRGGYLKIQGTWLPFDIAKQLAARTCYPIRMELIPIFGAEFPEMCYTPDMPGYGHLSLTDPQNIKRKRASHRTGPQPLLPNDAACKSSDEKPSKRQKTEVLSPLEKQRRAMEKLAARKDLTPSNARPKQSQKKTYEHLPNVIQMAHDDLVRHLQATQSLQMLAEGGFNNHSRAQKAGGRFVWDGRLCQWDGRDNIIYADDTPALLSPIPSFNGHSVSNFSSPTKCDFDDMEKQSTPDLIECGSATSESSIKKCAKAAGKMDILNFVD